MKLRAILGPLLLLATAAQGADVVGTCPEALSFSKRPLGGGDPVDLCASYRGRVVLIVNTASKCAFTPQYDGLEQLYREYRDRGLVVIGFPSNDFGNQEPGSEEEIREFCRLTYKVQFPMFEKTRVAEGQADPLYRTLSRLSGEYPRWNFHKYLLDRQGNLVASFPSQVDPLSAEMRRAIEGLL